MTRINRTLPHTAGPWHATRDAIVTDEGIVLARRPSEMQIGMPLRSVAHQNLRIMAAAPEMLAALRGLVDALTADPERDATCPGDCAAAVAAIEAAEGGTE